MEKYTLKELRNLVRSGVAQDATQNLPNNWEKLERMGYSCGIYGVNGGLMKDPKTGELYAILSRNSNLFRIL